MNPLEDCLIVFGVAQRPTSMSASFCTFTLTSILGYLTTSGLGAEARGLDKGSTASLCRQKRNAGNNLKAIAVPETLIDSHRSFRLN